MDLASLGFQVDTSDLRQAANDLGRVTNAAERAGNAAGDVGRKADQASRQVKTATSRMADDVDRASRAAQQLQRVFTALAGSMAIRELLRTAEAMQRMENQLRLVTKSTDDLRRTQTALFSIAQQSRSALNGVTDLYARLARSTADLGVSQARLLQVTESVSQAITISGASAQSAEAALFQLGQGLAAGALRGEELNSVLEQTPRLAQALADGLGVSVGQLRKLGEQGALTAERVIGALESQAAAIGREFATMQRTTGQAVQQLENDLARVVDEAFRATNATATLNSTIDDLRAIITDPAFTTAMQVVVGLVASAAREAGEAARAVGNLVTAIRDLDMNALGDFLVDGSILGLARRTGEGLGILDKGSAGPVSLPMPPPPDIPDSLPPAVERTAKAYEDLSRMVTGTNKAHDDLRKQLDAVAGPCIEFPADVAGDPAVVAELEDILG